MFPFLPNQLIIGNKDSDVAICCGWTPRNNVNKLLVEHDSSIMQKVACIGQLYTAERGVDMMVRNLLAVPSISELILVGNDKTKSMTQLYGLWKNKTLTLKDKNWSYENIAINGDIPKDVIIDLLNRIRIWKGFNADIIDMWNEFQITSQTTTKRISVSPQLFQPVKREPDDYPAPNNVCVVRGKTIQEAYTKIIYNVMTFGKRIHTHYDQDSKEIMNLVSVVTNQDPYEDTLAAHIPFTIDHLNDYRKKILNPDKDPNVTYTYGNRMRLHFGVDQVANTITKINNEPITRSAVISLWDSTGEKGSYPCLNHIWFRVIDNLLHMTATIRSNDMYFGWPENAYGLRYLQEYVRKNLNFECSLGDLTINSQSAHIYEDCWGTAEEIIKLHKYDEWFDEKGQWTFEHKDGVVSAAELHLKDKFITRIEGTPAKIRREIARRNLISDVGHALYVGSMIEKKQSSIEGVLAKRDANVAKLRHPK